MVCNFFFSVEVVCHLKKFEIHHSKYMCVCVPECFITTRSQMAVHKAHWGAVKEKRNSYCSLISCNHQDKTNYSSLGLFSLATKYKGGEKRGKSRVSSLVSVLVCFKKKKICTKRVPQASFYTSGVYLTDASFMLWFYKHSQSDIPKGLYCHLQEETQNTLTISSHHCNTLKCNLIKWVIEIHDHLRRRNTVFWSMKI